MPKGRGLAGLIGIGVGAVAEYHEHRKEKKAARSNSETTSQTDQASAGPSHRPNNERLLSDNLPPSYNETADVESGRIVDAGSAAVHNNKDAHSQHSDDDSDSSSLDDLAEDDEEDWQLDEIAADTEPPSYQQAMSTGSNDDEALVREVLADHKQSNSPGGVLPCPVIVPQRRPRDKSRGFVRAYAPVLENVGIKQDVFLSFLKNFHKSSQANPIYTAIMLAGGITSNVPHAIAMAVGIAVQVAAGFAKEIDARKKTNTFLDRMNDELFKPAGCFAFIMTYKTDEEVANQKSGLFHVKPKQVDFSANQAFLRYDRSGQVGEDGKRAFKDKMKDIRLASGQTRGSMQMPDAAPLIFPEIDDAMQRDGVTEENFKDKAKDAQKFIASYFDRRAHMKYSQEDPSGALVIPEEQRQFRSKLADPHHPMFNNGPIGLLTGGLLKPRDRKMMRRNDKFERKLERREYKAERRADKRERRMVRHGLSPDDARDRTAVRRRSHGKDPDYGKDSEPVDGLSQGLAGMSTGDSINAPYDRRARRRKGGAIGTVKRMLQEDVLYLMIVNMPSEAELAEAKEMLEKEQAAKEAKDKAV